MNDGGGVEAAAEFDDDLGAGERGEFVGHRVDHPLVAGVGLAAVAAFGAAPGHRAAVIAPVGARPPPDGGGLGAVVDLGPVDAQWQLPTHRRLPLGRRLVGVERGEVEGTSLAAREARTVEEDAGAVDDPGVGAFDVAEDPVRSGRVVVGPAGDVVVLPARRIDHGGVRVDRHRLVEPGGPVTEVGAEGAAPLVQVGCGSVEDAEAPVAEPA